MAQVCMPTTGTRSLAAIDVLTADKGRRILKCTGLHSLFTFSEMLQN